MPAFPGCPGWEWVWPLPCRGEGALRGTFVLAQGPEVVQREEQTEGKGKCKNLVSGCLLRGELPAERGTEDAHHCVYGVVYAYKHT